MQVYYCGGINGANSHTVDSCWVYDTIFEMWTTRPHEEAAPKMPLGRNHAATCTDGQRMFVFGGRDGKNVLGPSFANTQVGPQLNNHTIFPSAHTYQMTPFLF